MHRPLLFQFEPPPTATDASNLLTAIRNAGFDGIELPCDSHELACPDERPARNDVLTPDTLRELAFRENAVALSPLPIDMDLAVATVRRGLQYAHTRTASVLSLTIPPVEPGNHPAGLATYQDGLNYAYRLCKATKWDAESSGVCIALEACTHGCLFSPVELREIIDNLHTPAVGATLDCTRIARLTNPVDWITTLGRRTACIRLPVPDGVTPQPAPDPIPRIRTALDPVRYSGPIIATGDPTPDTWRIGLASLRP